MKKYSLENHETFQMISFLGHENHVKGERGDKEGWLKSILQIFQKCLSSTIWLKFKKKLNRDMTEKQGLNLIRL